MPEGVYRVWFYNHAEPFIMKFYSDTWYYFPCDVIPDDEIDFTERPPQWLGEGPKPSVTGDRPSGIKFVSRW